jgi:hypothetical protein
MPVNIEHRDFRPAEEILDQHRVVALRQEERRQRMSEAMEPKSLDLVSSRMYIWSAKTTITLAARSAFVRVAGISPPNSMSDVSKKARPEAPPSSLCNASACGRFVRRA